MLFATPVALATPVRIYEVNNNFPAEEETNPASAAGATHNQIRQRFRFVCETFQPVLKVLCVVTRAAEITRTTSGTSEHYSREGLGTPLRL